MGYGLAFLFAGQILGLLVLALVLRAQVRQIRDQIRQIRDQTQTAITELVSSPGEDQPSPLAQIVGQLGQAVGTQVAYSLRQSLLGSSGAVARQEKALVQDALEDQIDAQAPLLGFLMDAAGPKVKKRLAKNPAAIQAAMQLAGQFLGNNGPGSSGSSGRSDWYPQRR